MANFDFIRLSIRGTLPGGESWSVNPVFNRFNSYSGIQPADMNAAALAVRNVTAPANLRNLISSAGDITSFRLEGRTYANDLVLAGEAGAPGGSVPGTGTASKPYQTSIVSSLLTGYAGASNRGRLYWPALGAVIGGNLRLTTPTPANVALAVGSYLKDIQLALSTIEGMDGSVLCVYSSKNGIVRPVTEVSVGDVLDVQRRRRDKAVESRTALAYPALS